MAESTSRNPISFRPSPPFRRRLDRLAKDWNLKPSAVAHRLAIVAACGFDQGMIPVFDEFRQFTSKQAREDPFLAVAMSFRDRFARHAAEPGNTPYTRAEEVEFIRDQLQHYKDKGVTDVENLAFVDASDPLAVPD